MRARADDEAERSRIAPGLTADERRLSPSGLLLKYLKGVPDELADPSTNIGDPRWRQFDAVAWPAFLAARGANEAAIQLMTLGGDSAAFPPSSCCSRSCCTAIPASI